MTQTTSSGESWFTASDETWITASGETWITAIECMSSGGSTYNGTLLQSNIAVKTRGSLIKDSLGTPGIRRNLIAVGDGNCGKTALLVYFIFRLISLV
jgi:hypothetical protein